MRQAIRPEAALVPRSIVIQWALSEDFPMQALDHIVVNTRTDLDQALALYERLGFFLTPRGYHSLGTANNLAIFEKDYLELIGIPVGAVNVRLDLTAFPKGLNGVVFRTPDADAEYKALVDRGLPAQPPLAFSRPVQLGSGSEEARFRTVRLEPGTFETGRVYFCEHRTPELVWRPEWQRHPNGACGMAFVVWVAKNPQRYADPLSRLLGPDSVKLRGSTFVATSQTFEIRVMEFGAARDEYRSALPESADGASDYMAVVGVRTRDLAKARSLLRENHVSVAADPCFQGRLVVPASAAANAAIEFV